MSSELRGEMGTKLQEASSHIQELHDLEFHWCGRLLEPRQVGYRFCKHDACRWVELGFDDDVFNQWCVSWARVLRVLL